MESIEARLAKIEAGLQDLRDRHDILTCIYTYSRAIDRRDWPLMKKVFHDDAIDNHGDFVGTIPEYLAWFKPWFGKDRYPNTHNITCHLCEIDGDVAHTESYVIFGSQYADVKTFYLGGGRYIDRFEKRKGKWRIALRRAYVDWRCQAEGVAVRGGYPRGAWDKTDWSYMRPLDLSPELKRVLAKGKRK